MTVEEIGPAGGNVRSDLIEPRALPFFPLALAVSRQNAQGCRHFGLENRKYFRCPWKWEIDPVAVGVRKNARNTLENKVIELVR